MKTSACPWIFQVEAILGVIEAATLRLVSRVLG